MSPDTDPAEIKVDPVAWQQTPAFDMERACSNIVLAIERRLYWDHPERTDESPFPLVKVDSIDPQPQGPFYFAEFDATIDWYELDEDEARLVDSHDVPTLVWLDRQMRIIKVMPRLD